LPDGLDGRPKREHFRGVSEKLAPAASPAAGRQPAIDSEWLLIWLDDRGRFERYEVTTD
jgi:hypothetical protein